MEGSDEDSAGGAGPNDGGAGDGGSSGDGGAGEAVSPLRLLLEVQARDLTIDQLEYRRRELPERKAVAELDGRIAALDARANAVRSEWARLSQRQSEIDGQVTALTERIGAIESRMRQSGDYRDTQAMSTESESLARHRRELEDAEIEVMEQLEPVEAELAVVDGEVAALRDQRAVAAEELVTAEAAVDDEMVAVRQERARVAAGVPADLAASYERLRARLGGVGAARLVDGSCSGCHLRLPSSERERVLHAGPDEIAYCDQCGRILVA